MADILKKIGEDKEKSTALEDAFKSCRYPDSLSMSFLAADIGITEEEIEVWKSFFFSVSVHGRYSQKNLRDSFSIESVRAEISLSTNLEDHLKF